MGFENKLVNSYQQYVKIYIFGVCLVNDLKNNKTYTCCVMVLIELSK